MVRLGERFGCAIGAVRLPIVTGTVTGMTVAAIGYFDTGETLFIHIGQALMEGNHVGTSNFSANTVCIRSRMARRPSSAALPLT